MKHTTKYDKPLSNAQASANCTILEIQVVDIADEIAYDNHDLDDGITSVLIREDELRQLKIWRDKSAQIGKKYPRISDEMRKYQIIKSLIDDQVTDLLKQTEANLKRYKIRTLKDVPSAPSRIVSFSPKMQEMRKPMRTFLSKNLYQHYRVVRMSNKAFRFVTSLFNVYLDQPEQLPPNTQARLKSEDKHRVICDYIAGMTDRYALDEYKKFFDPRQRIFHYGILCDFSETAGFALMGWNHLNAFIIGGQSLVENHPKSTKSWLSLAAAMHEVGHTCGLIATKFKGIDNKATIKPYYKEFWIYLSYRSIMNYLYTYSFMDYSDGSHGRGDFNDWGNLDFSFFKNTHFEYPIT